MTGTPHNCPPPDVLLAARSGVLPEESGTGIRAHLEECRYCQALAADLTDPEVASPSASELGRIRTRVDRGIAAPRRSAFRLGRLVWMGAALAVLVVAFYVGTRQASPPIETAGPVSIPKQTPPEIHLPLERAPLKLPLATATLWRGEAVPAREKYLAALGEALVPYRAGDYSGAAGRLQNLSAKYPKAVEPPFYLGVSLLFLHRNEDAAVVLERARGLKPDALKDDVEWYLGVAWEGSGKKQQAASVLEPLCGRDGPYRSLACDGLRWLR